ncbi:hypothetical protein [Paraburkholderia rhizosphaerae]|uniref:Uncharacterized protein n=1 Tax=Paraburkholderia rhizosphaerae TaxID=480658 RepID=A0A4R8LYM9_9BURK|nr:hypothetical protein [Paraburkholderia rhizosphaerae]TDY52366.1 hypothetical protein BX592_105250 [Paraburkholderia rhizosphaerae]
MLSPQGSVIALSSASATVFSLGIVFLGYWGITEPSGWTGIDRFIAGIALLGFAFLGLVPWMATSPVEPDASDAKIRVARRMFVAGVGFIWLAIVVAVVI